MSRFLIVGGTGTLGRETTRRLLEQGHEVVCVSRCELKQKETQAAFKNSSLSFILGDIRDREKMMRVCRGYQAVFHFAALKHVEVMEDNPDESVKTNINGTMNVADACIENRVPHMVFSSTDKAVDPVNVYGFSKALSERILLQRNRVQRRTQFSVFRWGNVVGSRGSAILSFAQTLRDEGKAYITDPGMSRFWIKIEDAVEFMLSQYSTAPRDAVCIPPIKSASLPDVIEATASIIGVTSYQLKNVGLRPGEKLHEALRSIHEVEPLESHRAPKYSRDELIKLLRPLLENATIKTRGRA